MYLKYIFFVIKNNNCIFTIVKTFNFYLQHGKKSRNILKNCN